MHPGRCVPSAANKPTCPAVCPSPFSSISAFPFLSPISRCTTRSPVPCVVEPIASQARTQARSKLLGPAAPQRRVPPEVRTGSDSFARPQPWAVRDWCARPCLPPAALCDRAPRLPCIPAPAHPAKSQGPRQAQPPTFYQSLLIPSAPAYFSSSVDSFGFGSPSPDCCICNAPGCKHAYCSPHSTAASS